MYKSLVFGDEFLSACKVLSLTTHPRGLKTTALDPTLDVTVFTNLWKIHKW